MSRAGNSLSPFQQGFAALGRDPALMAGELLWRWCFGFSAWALALLSAALFLDSLTVSPVDQLLLGTLQPVLLRTAAQDIFRGSLLRFLWVGVVLFIGLTLLWAFAATAGRAATLRRLVEMFCGDEEDVATWQFRPIFALSLLRAAWSILAIAAASASLLYGVIMAQEKHPGRAAFFLTFGVALACVFGYVLNWFLGLAPLFCIRDEVGAREALDRAVEFCAARAGRLLGVSVAFLAVWALWVVAVLAFFFAAFSLAEYVGARWVALLTGLIAVVYFAGADLLYLARLGAYVSLAEEPEEQGLSEIAPNDLSPPDVTSLIELPSKLEPA